MRAISDILIFRCFLFFHLCFIFNLSFAFGVSSCFSEDLWLFVAIETTELDSGSIHGCVHVDAAEGSRLHLSEVSDAGSHSHTHRLSLRKHVRCNTSWHGHTTTTHHRKEQSV